MKDELRGGTLHNKRMHKIPFLAIFYEHNILAFIHRWQKNKCEHWRVCVQVFICKENYQLLYNYYENIMQSLIFRKTITNLSYISIYPFMHVHNNISLYESPLTFQSRWITTPFLIQRCSLKILSSFVSYLFPITFCESQFFVFVVGRIVKSCFGDSHKNRGCRFSTTRKIEVFRPVKETRKNKNMGKCFCFRNAKIRFVKYFVCLLLLVISCSGCICVEHDAVTSASRLIQQWRNKSQFKKKKPLRNRLDV